MTPDIHFIARDAQTTSWELTPSSMIVPTLPRFMLGGFPPRLSAFWYRHLGLHHTGVFRCSDVTISGAYLLSREHIFCCPEANIHPPHIEEQLPQLRTRKLAVRQIGGICALICGPGHNIFGHWMIDFLPKLYALSRYPIDPTTITYLMPSDIAKFVKEILFLFGVPDSQITYYDVEREAVRAETLLIPTTPHNGLRTSPVFKDFADWAVARIASLNRTRDMATPERVFVARGRHYLNRPLTNRAEIEALATARNIALIYPEELSLLEQWHLFAKAKLIVGEYGSALHSSIFSPAGTVVCCLRGTMDHPGFVQSGIGAALGQPTGYVFGENAPGTDGGFTVAATDFSLCLDLLEREF